MIADECRIMAKHVQARRVIILHIIVLQTTTVKKTKNPWFSILLLRSHHRKKDCSLNARSQLCRSLPLAFLPTRCLQAPGSTITFTCVCVQSCHFGLLLGSSRMNLCKEIYVSIETKSSQAFISVRLCRLFLRLLLGENSNIFLSHARSLVSTILLLL